MSVCIVTVELTLDGAELAPGDDALRRAIEAALSGLDLDEPAHGVIIDDARVHTIGPVSAR